MAEITGSCICCGQVQIVAGGDEMTYDQVNHQATLQCDCEGAQWLQKVEEKKSKAAENIQRLFEEDGQEFVEMLLLLVSPLALKEISKFTATTAAGIKATLTAKEKSIKIERTETKKSCLED